MDKTHTDFLQECQAELAQLKERLAALEAKLEAFQEAHPEPEDVPEEISVDLPVDMPLDGAEDIPDDIPVDFTDMEMEPVSAVPPVSVVQPVQPAPPAPAQAAPVPDETASLPWRKDRPGVPVKNIRSGISLLDRALFIGTLFHEDVSLYESTIRDLNQFVSLDQAVDYVRTHFPDWNLRTEEVYRFMMAIRKKLG